MLCPPCSSLVKRAFLKVLSLIESQTRRGSVQHKCCWYSVALSCFQEFPLTEQGDSKRYSASLRSRSALVITVTELKVIAAAATMGLSSRPKNG